MASSPRAGAHAITSGLEVTWTSTPTKWGNEFFRNLFGYEWELTKSPAGAHQWRPKNGGGAGTIPDAHDLEQAHRALDADDGFVAAVRPRLREDLAALHGAPGSVPGRLRARLVQADPSRHGAACALLSALKCRRKSCSGRTRSPAVNHKLIDEQDIAALQGQDPGVGTDGALSFVSTAWASASTFRGSDKRGGANGARIRLAPQKDWAVNEPAQLARVLKTPEGIQSRVQQGADGRQEGIARGPDRARRIGCRRAGGEECRPDGEGSVHTGAHGRVAGADRR